MKEISDLINQNKTRSTSPLPSIEKWHGDCIGWFGSAIEFIGIFPLLLEAKNDKNKKNTDIMNKMLLLKLKRLEIS